jgi:hypothetical protein
MVKRFRVKSGYCGDLSKRSGGPRNHVSYRRRRDVGDHERREVNENETLGSIGSLVRERK